MALFNYSSQYSTISPKLTATAGSADWLKIFVSPDASGGGHLITHGIDFGRVYDGSRGLVPANSASDLTKTYLRGDGWASFWSSAAQAAAAGNGTAASQAANIESYLQSTLVSAYDIKQWIANSFAANDAMRFKGTISVAQNNSISYNDGSNHNNFPTSCEVGDTYKVTSTTNKTLAGQNVNSGDMLICIKAGSGSSLNDAQYWTVVQSNVESLTQYTINGAAHFIYTQNNVGGTFYAPTSAGNQGQVLLSEGSSSAPTWANANTLVVAEAGKVTNYLTKGTGLSFKVQGVEMTTGRYNGSEAVTIAVLPATTSTLGGVIIDGGTHSTLYDGTNAPNDKKPTVTVANTGEIYLTQQNIINALGYTPGNSTGTVTGVVVAASNSAATNTTSVTANPYINIIAGNTVLGSYRISGSGAISVSSSTGSAALVVSGSVFTASVDGLVPMASTANKQTNSSDNIASQTTFLLGADAKWYKLPASSFVGTWRNIKVNGTQILDTTVTNGKALDLVAGSHVTISALQTSNAYDGRIQIAAAWRDVQIHKITTNNGSTTISSSVASIGNNDSLVFDNSESVFTVGEEITTGSGNNATTKTVVKSYITWYNMDDGSYELV